MQKPMNDKAKHFLMSYLIRSALEGAGLPAPVAGGTTAAIGIGKELIDSQPGGSGFDFGDITANLAGIAAHNNRDGITFGYNGDKKWIGFGKSW